MKNGEGRWCWEMISFCVEIRKIILNIFFLEFIQWRFIFLGIKGIDVIVDLKKVYNLSIQMKSGIIYNCLWLKFYLQLLYRID